MSLYSAAIGRLKNSREAQALNNDIKESAKHLKQDVMAAIANVYPNDIEAQAKVDKIFDKCQGAFYFRG